MEEDEVCVCENELEEDKVCVCENELMYSYSIFTLHLNICMLLIKFIF